MDIYEAITLSGGGAKGVIQLGVLYYYEEQRLLDFKKVKEYAGTSIGSAICTLLVCGYTPLELFSKICSIDDFISSRKNSIFVTWENILKMGLFNIDDFCSLIEEFIIEKIGHIPSFLELYQKTGKKLSVSGSNITKMVEEKYSVDTTPNMSCLKAIKRSCCLPGVFGQIEEDGICYADGGLVNNFPWDYISPGLKTLGVVTMNDDSQITKNKFGYIAGCIILPINTLTLLRLSSIPSNVNAIVVISDLSTLQLSLSLKEKMDMFSEGYQEAKRKDRCEYLYIPGWNDKFEDKESDKIIEEIGYEGWDFEWL
jgi:predicted acylesterase/phospholipase RssA